MLFVASFLTTVLAILVLRRYATGLKLIAGPGAHRAHTGYRPVVGGIAMFLGLTCGLALAGTNWPLWACALIVVVAGTWDDINELSTGTRIYAQIIASSVMIYWGEVVLFDLGYLVSPDSLFYLGRWAVALTVFGAVGVMNAINMSDGMDGLAGGITLISAATLLILAIVSGHSEGILELSLLLTVVIAFMLFNLRTSDSFPARVFMGDAGSTLLGLVLVWYLIKYTQPPHRLFTPVTALWILALPLFDAVGVLIRRTLRGKSPFNADRSHYHHYLQDMGFSVNKALVISLGTALGFTIIGVSGFLLNIPERFMFLLFLILFLVYMLLLYLLERRRTA